LNTNYEILRIVEVPQFLLILTLIQSSWLGAPLRVYLFSSAYFIVMEV